MAQRRLESAVTTLSWVPEEAVAGAARVLPEAGPPHFDPPPPEVLTDLEALGREDRYRFANHLEIAGEFDDADRGVAAEYLGGGMLAATSLRFTSLDLSFLPFAMPDLKAPPAFADGSIRFTQTTGGRIGVPMQVRRRLAPLVQWRSPLVWTTLTATLHADAQVEHALSASSTFPRHWLYGADGYLLEKSGLLDATKWTARSFTQRTPWGDESSEAFSALEVQGMLASLRQTLKARAAQPRVTHVPAGSAIARQGDTSDDLVLLLGGLARVERDGEAVAEYGPGALLFEPSHLRGGGRSSSVFAAEQCRLATVPLSSIDRAKLARSSRPRRSGATTSG